MPSALVVKYGVKMACNSSSLILTAIRDDDFHPLTIGFACRYANDAVTANRLHCIQVQIQQHLIQAIGVGADRG